MAFASCAGVFVLADDASAESVSSADLTLSDNIVVTEGEVTATLSFQEQDTEIFSSASYTAKLTNASGVTQSSALTPSSGSIDNNSTVDIKVTMPSTAGTYKLEVTITERFSDNTESKIITVSKTIEAKAPLTLSVKLENTGSLAITNTTVFFYVDGKKIDDSEQKISIEAGSSETVTYKYFDKNLSSGRHTYCLMAGDTAYAIEGLGVEYEFYYHQGDYNYMVYLMVVLLIIMIIFVVWVFRKPVKNYGKPKARR